MRKFIFLTALMFICGVAHSAPIVLYGSDNVEKGTSSNPLKVSFSGDQTMTGSLTAGSIITTATPGKISSNVYVDHTIYMDSNANGITIDPNIYTTGKIGIGTTGLSTERLRVKSSAVGTSPVVVRRSSDANNLFDIAEDGAGAGGFRLYDGSGTMQVNISSNGSSFLSRTNSYNIGIGTVSPDSRLTVGLGVKSSVNGVDDILVKDSIEVDGNIYIDTAIYGTNQSGAYLYVRQPDAGCSRCGVDAAGTTWSCINITCLYGM